MTRNKRRKESKATHPSFIRAISILFSVVLNISLSTISSRSPSLLLRSLLRRRGLTESAGNSSSRGRSIQTQQSSHRYHKGSKYHKPYPTLTKKQQQQQQQRLGMAVKGDDRFEEAAERMDHSIASRGGGGGRGRKGGRRGGGGGGGGGPDREVVLSKALSSLLRHQAQSAGIKLDAEGYAPLDKVVSLSSLSLSLSSF